MIIQWVGNFIFFYKPDNLSMIFQLIQNDNPISYKLVGIDPVDPFLCNVLFRPIFTSIMFCLDQNVYDMLYYIIYHFISHHLIISIHFSVYCSYYNSVPFTSASMSILTFEQVSPLFRFGFTLSKTVVYCVCMSPS